MQLLYGLHLYSAEVCYSPAAVLDGRYMVWCLLYRNMMVTGLSWELVVKGYWFIRGVCLSTRSYGLWACGLVL